MSLSNKIRKNALILLFCSCPVLLFSRDAGKEEIFDYGAGGRALGMGNAFTAAADDSSAVYWNPGAMGLLDYSEVMFLHAFLPYGTMYDTLSFVYPTVSFGTFGFGMFRIGTGDIIFRDSHNITTAEGVSASQMQFLISYGIKVRLPFSFGTAIKINTENFGTFSDANISFDLGLLIPCFGPDWQNVFGKFQLKNLALGINVKNLISTPIKLSETAETEELNVKTGVSYRYGLSRDHRFLLALDLNFFSGKEMKINAGLEYNLFRMAFIRTGYNQNTGLVIGAGFEYFRIRLDYSLALQEIDATHRVSALWRFGRSIQEQRGAEKERIQREIMVRVEKEVEVKTKEYRENLQKTIEELNTKYAREKEKIVNDMNLKSQEEKDRLNNELKLKYEEEKARLVTSLSNRYESEKEDLKKNLANRLLANEQVKNQHYNRGVELYSQEDYDNAIIEFETVLKFDPNHRQAREFLQKARGAKRNPTTYSKEIMGLYYQGIDFYVAGEYRKAIDVWNRILRIDPYNNLALKNIADAEKKLKELERIKKTR